MNPGAPEPSFVPERYLRRGHDRYWLHLLLLLIAFATTTWAGAAFSRSFQQNQPIQVEDFVPTLRPAFPIASGLPYSLTLLMILLAHEFGHYFACRYYGIDASLPYFLGVPTVIGTFGAFIRIRSPILSRRQLFDIGIAGPLAGFAFVIPAMAIGLAWSRVIPGIANTGEVVFGTPLILRGLEALIFPGVPSADIYLHPVARAAWVGVMATALNLMPVGQLDGGHILFATAERYHRPMTWVFIAFLIPCGLIYSWTWLVWAALLTFVARRHPRVYDHTPVGSGRNRLGFVSLFIFVLSFSLTPVQI